MERISYKDALTKKWEVAPKSKYGNQKTHYKGILFDSKHEARCAEQLDTMRKAKHPFDRVVDVKYQVRYPILIKKKKICTYIADFVVKYADGRVEVQDAKGVRTEVYKLKKKLIKAYYNIDIIEL